MSEDTENKLKESNNEEPNVDDYQAKEETTLTSSDISSNKNREKNRKNISDNEKESERVQ